MKRILKLSDISVDEAKHILSRVRYSSLLNAKIEETNEGIVATFEVTPDNRVVFAGAFKSLEEYVYTDTDQTAFERICDIAEVRNLRFVLCEQGTRGEICHKLLETSEKFDSYIAFAGTFGSKEQMLANFDAGTLEDVAQNASAKFAADVAVSATTEFADDPSVPSTCNVAIQTYRGTFSNKYHVYGTKSEVAKKFAFLCACLLARKIF